MTPKLKLYSVGAGVLLVLGLIVGAYRRGKSIGEESQKIAQLDSLKVIANKRAEANSLIASEALKRADSAERVAKAASIASDRWREKAEKAREKVTVSGDTVNGTVQPEVADLIRASDSARAQDAFTVSVQEITISKKDSAIAALNQVVSDLTEGIKIRDAEIGVLKKAKRPRFGFKSGAIVGAAIVTALLVKH